MDDALIIVEINEKNTAISIANTDGSITHTEKYSLDIADITPETWSWEIGGLIAKTLGLENEKRSSKAIVISFPGFIDMMTGKIISSPFNKKLNNFSITNDLKINIDSPISAESKIKNALIGEHWQGIGQGVHNIIYIDLKDMYNAALLIDDQIIHGANLLAGELEIPESIKTMQHLGGEKIENIIKRIIDLAIIIDSEMIIIDAKKNNIDAIISLMKSLIKEKNYHIKIEKPMLEEKSSLMGAIKIALTLSFENTD
ncbi:MAG: Sugar kinase of the NBD/HSP70 family, may containing an N-terminal HTH domain [Chloroflexi bacterium]|jgi:hypothetical protein|nr:MAG: Sugar kinase of the NBD/HSP70 family, may containing an N-terminal HTH domain [Chloroflexota bacterium]|tara:strand:+ start:3894 stop:4664 length:771 start_codon:yes stop_codon:yes gene_type:complete